MKTRLIVLLTATVLGAAACGEANASGAGESGDAAATTQVSSSGGGEVASLNDGTNGDTGQADTEVVDTETELLAFAQCIRDQGFEIDDPTVDANGNVRLPRGERPTEEFFEARDNCSEFLEGLTLGANGGDQTAQQDQLLAFASCMRDNGFDMPDPDFSSAGGGRRLLQDVDQDDPTYQTALASCGDILGAGRGG